MPSDQEKAGRPRVLLRRHVLEIKKETRKWIDDLFDSDGEIGGFLSKFDAGKIPVARIIGAGITAAGTYMMAVWAIKAGKQAGKFVVEAADVVRDSVLGFFVDIFKRSPFLPGTVVSADALEAQILKGPAVLGFLESKEIDPLAIGPALIAGGMVLAGLNPGEVLKGIGEILPG